MVEYEELEITGRDERAYLLNTMLKLDPTETPEEAFGQLVQAINGWIDVRGTDCGGLGVAIVAPSDKHETLVAYLLSLVQQEETLRDFFKRIGSVNVMLAESEDGEASQFTIQVDDSNEKPEC
jgi:hypothetical protein